MFSYLRDKASAFATTEDVAKAAIKATTHDPEIPPKAKHLRTLYECIFRQGGEMGRESGVLALRTLRKRMEGQRDWVVLVKALIVFHHLIRDESSCFRDLISTERFVFNLQSYTDTSSPDAFDKSVFIRTYSRYVEELAFFYRTPLITHCHGQFTLLQQRTIPSLSPPEIGRFAKSIGDVMDALLACRLQASTFDSPITAAALQILLADSCRILPVYHSLSLRIIEEIWNWDLQTAKAAAFQFGVYERTITNLSDLYDYARKLSPKYSSLVPEISPMPVHLSKSMDLYVRGLESGLSMSEAASAAQRSSSSLRNPNIQSPASGEREKPMSPGESPDKVPQLTELLSEAEIREATSGKQSTVDDLLNFEVESSTSHTTPSTSFLASSAGNNFPSSTHGSASGNDDFFAALDRPAQPPANSGADIFGGPSGSSNVGANNPFAQEVQAPGNSGGETGDVRANIRSMYDQPRANPGMGMQMGMQMGVQPQYTAFIPMYSTGGTMQQNPQNFVQQGNASNNVTAYQQARAKKQYEEAMLTMSTDNAPSSSGNNFNISNTSSSNKKAGDNFEDLFKSMKTT